MNWSDHDPDLPAASTYLSPDDNPGRGCFYGVLLGVWLSLCVGGALFGLGFLLAGVRIP